MFERQIRQASTFRGLLSGDQYQQLLVLYEVRSQRPAKVEGEPRVGPARPYERVLIDVGIPVSTTATRCAGNRFASSEMRLNPTQQTLPRGVPGDQKSD